MLGPTTKHLLESAAILGERMDEADLTLLYRALEHPSAQGQTPRTIEEELTELHGFGLLENMGNGQRLFPNRLLREVILGTIPAPRRRRLHYEAAHSLDAIKRSNTLCAMHMLRGGGATLAEVLVKSAAEASKNFDDHKSVSLYRAARRVSNSSSASNQEKEAHSAQILVKITEPLCYIGGEKEAIAMIQEFLARPESTLSPASIATLQHALGKAFLRAGQGENAVEALQRAIGPTLASGEPHTILSLYSQLSDAFVSTKHMAQALRESREGFDLCTLGQGPRSTTHTTLWRYLLQISSLYKNTHNLREARTWCEHALFQAEQHQDTLGMMRCQCEMAALLRTLKQETLAQQHLSRALDCAREFGDRKTTAELLLERARYQHAQNQQEEASHSLEEALRLSRTVDWEQGAIQAQSALSMLGMQAKQITVP